MQSSTQTTIRNDHKGIRYFITYGICFIALGLTMASFGPVLPNLADHINVSLAKVSFLFTASSLGYLIGSAGGGRLYDRFKGHTLMIFALTILIVTCALIPFIPIFVPLLFVMFLFGMGQGTLDVGANVNLLWVYQSRVGPYMNALHFCFGIGAFLSPIIINNVLNITGGKLIWPFLVLAILSLPGLLGLILLKSPQNPEKHDETHQGHTSQTRLVVLMMLLFFIYVGVEGGFGNWIYTYATKVNIATETAASYMNSLFWGALTLGRLFSILLAKKLVPSKILIGNFSLSIIFLGLILIWPVNPMVLWIGSAGLGFSLSSVFPTLLAMGETRMKITGRVTGLFFMGSSLGGMVVPTILGQIFDYIGSYEIMLALFSIAALGLIVLIFVITASNKVGEKARP
ncbi:MAG: MFS transporter [Chloroflexota bacterium]|nr:MFS transporter [Chloroflexota bacterium]